MSQTFQDSLPLVAIVGRPNVGKSTLFNRLMGKRVVVVHNEAGTTRDRIYGDLEWDGQCFGVVDTGGLVSQPLRGLEELIVEQVKTAIREAGLCLLMVDIKAGLTPLDKEVAAFLRREGKEVVVVMNKADGKQSAWSGEEFYPLGFEDYLPVSALHGLGIGELLELMVTRLPHFRLPKRSEQTSIAIVGRPNTGKSTLVNRLLGKDRVLIDDIPGTTRDAVNTPLVWNGKSFLLIDTAGLLRKVDSQAAVGRFSLSRTQRAISQSDVVLLLLALPDFPTRVDARFIHIALDKGKGCIIGVNKWDLAGSLSPDEYRGEIQHHLAFAGFLPVVFLSALKGQGLEEVMEAGEYVATQRTRTVQTAVLNRILQNAQESVPPRRKKGKPLKIYYATQIKTAPPVFRLFVNNPHYLYKNYEQYLVNILRRALGFEGVPIRLDLKRRNPVRS